MIKPYKELTFTPDFTFSSTHCGQATLEYCAIMQLIPKYWTLTVAYGCVTFMAGLKTSQSFVGCPLEKSRAKHASVALIGLTDPRDRLSSSNVLSCPSALIDWTGMCQAVSLVFIDAGGFCFLFVSSGPRRSWMRSAVPLYVGWWRGQWPLMG